MRWTWLIPRMILVSLIWGLVAFGLDPWLRHSAVQSVQSVTGARADVDSLTTGLFPPVLSVKGVALASASSPGTNLVEFDELKCRLGGHALLRRSVVIEEASLTGVRFSTVRNDDGQLEEVPETQNTEPSWLTEKLKNAGEEWLDQLVVDVRQQLDPNSLETWRTGQTLSVKWEQKLETLQERLKLLQPRVDQLQQGMDEAKQLGSVAQIERYLSLAAEGEQLLQEARQLNAEIQAIVPEVRDDLRVLDEARRSDQEAVVQKIRTLKPTPRKITESLLGPQMYRQLHQALSWLEFGSNCRRQLKSQKKVVRHRGRDIEFPVLNPVPGFLCRRVEIAGELSLDQQLMPFHAVLSNVTSDPILLAQPAELRLQTSGEQPLQLAVRHDATTEVATTDVAAEYRETHPRTLRIGRDETALLTAGLWNPAWSARLRLRDSEIEGHISLRSSLQQAELTSSSMAPLLKSAVVDVLNQLDSVDASIQVSGPVDEPALKIDSRLGEQVAAGVQTALRQQAEQVKAVLQARVGELADQQKRRLSSELSERYQTLVSQHKATFEKIQGAQRLLASVRSGPARPEDLFRQVSGSGLLSSDQEEKVNQQLKKRDQLLKGLGGAGAIFR